MKDTEIIGGTIGTALSGVGTALQSDEVLRIVSLIITIIGALLTYVIIPLVNWYKKSKKDGKITAEEIKEGFDTLQEGINQIDLKEKDKENGK